MDDIRTDHAASRTEREPEQPPDTGPGPEPRRRQVGPESEVRGGPEAAEKTLPDDNGSARKDRAKR